MAYIINSINIPMQVNGITKIGSVKTYQLFSQNRFCRKTFIVYNSINRVPPSDHCFVNGNGLAKIANEVNKNVGNNRMRFTCCSIVVKFQKLIIKYPLYGNATTW